MAVKCEKAFRRGNHRNWASEPVATNSRFYKLIRYGEAHIYDEVKMDYFAVSYPEFMIFDENFTRKNKAKKHFEETLYFDDISQTFRLFIGKKSNKINSKKNIDLRRKQI